MFVRCQSDSWTEQILLEEVLILLQALNSEIISDLNYLWSQPLVVSIVSGFHCCELICRGHIVTQQQVSWVSAARLYHARLSARFLFHPLTLTVSLPLGRTGTSAIQFLGDTVSKLNRHKFQIFVAPNSGMNKTNTTMLMISNFLFLWEFSSDCLVHAPKTNTSALWEWIFQMINLAHVSSSGDLSSSNLALLGLTLSIWFALLFSNVCFDH